MAATFAVTIDKAGGEPVFGQIRDQIAELIASAELKAGMRLPPVRRLAQELGVNPMTVARAYKELAERGLLEGRYGGGTFVRSVHETVAWLRPTSNNGQARPSLLSQRLFELAAAPGVIAFTANYPRPPAHSLVELQQCVATVMEEDFQSYFRYDPPDGRPMLRKAIADLLRKEGMALSEEDVVVTSGAQQGIDLVVRTLVMPGTPVVIERPAYYGAINAMRAANAAILEVPLQADGMDLDVLEKHLRRYRPALIYTNPTFQNPTGVTLSEEKRHALLVLARRHGVIVLEDDHYPELRFRGAPLPALRSLAEEDNQVLYIRGFGKALIPGLRVGYIVAPPSIRTRLLAMKALADLHSNALIQDALALFLGRGGHAATVKTYLHTYSYNQSLVRQGLSEGMPEATRIGCPDGGLSLWLTLPEGANVSELYFRAVERGVAFVAGEVFYASRPDWRSLRISFGSNNPEELKEGVARLCSVVRDLLAPPRARHPGGFI